ncbi:hypothetical protein [Pectobacterium parmentieri]|uniref:hypothetical protein n=1 Tax=Pectobacterium parmentieri TaxID=1905730 RepID=UPI0002F6BD5B|nr:hypothetical protein [Pectobacterium parmentieri]AYH01731.1 hypothetical protein C5E26_12740 [Pectobacterium parmentieri]AYH27998.1 hypothetical protein C5E20_13145 [Pectobacterium parmentieri]AYH32304.1 hypothetical protein C5E19_12175 [Pectobacterium parmentieri]MBI0469951.1 hypothetical protein [Pectobacterium parmentieri]MBI0492551.1 hypothetical protein [Pectobacterium parmentieri]
MKVRVGSPRWHAHSKRAMRLGGAEIGWIAPRHGKNGEIQPGQNVDCTTLLFLSTVPAAVLVKHQ